MERRNFIKLAVFSGVSLAAESCTTGRTSGKIDCHAHLWPEFPGRIPFQPGIRKEDVKPESFTAEDLMCKAAPFGVTRFVLVQHNYYHGFDPSYLVCSARKFPGHFAVVGSLDVKDKNLVKKIEEDAGTLISGYRVASKGKNDGWLSSPENDLMWQAAADCDQSVCLLRNRNVSLQSVFDKCKSFPQTKVVVDHFGHVDYNDRKEKEVLWRLSDLPNVYLKVSKFYGNGRQQPPYLDMLPFVEQVVQHFGSSRLMWGSDSPYQLEKPHTYGDSFEIINSKATFLSAEDKSNLFVKTAERVFFRG